jgi:hypothetical protein
VYEHAQEMLQDFEVKLVGRLGWDQLGIDRNWLFDALLMGSSSSIWQPQHCIDQLMPPQPRCDQFADENNASGISASKKMASLPHLLQPNLNIDARPFYSHRMPSLAAKPPPQNAPTPAAKATLVPDTARSHWQPEEDSVRHHHHGQADQSCETTERSTRPSSASNPAP